MFRETAVRRGPDMILLIATLILVTVGTVMIYSSSSIMAMERFNDGQYFLKKQLLYVLLGLVIMAGMMRFPYERLRSFAYPGVILSAVLLLLVLVPVIGMKVGGARRWIRLGFLSFQVTEFVKLAVVLFLAHFLTRKMAYLGDIKKGVIAPFVVVMTLIVLIAVEPDFGTAVITFSLTMFMLYLAGTPVRYLCGILVIFLPVAVWVLLSKSYRLERIKAFLNPWSDPQHSGFQIIQSLLSFGSGGTFGVGVGDGMQKLFYLPEPHTDFILAVIAEESGFLGVTMVIFLFGVLVTRGFFISLKAPDTFSSLLAAGLTMVIALEAFVNIAGVMGMIPLKGLALPFLSYGGSSLVMSLAAVGILLNISTYET
ncbi:MAG: putative lipid II flippase FtsW [Syntrophales bacterium]|nr:putative lipid II flippase FtsW [Syntrophales bacterium]